MATTEESREFHFDDFLTSYIRKSFHLPTEWNSDKIKLQWTDIETLYNSFSEEEKQANAEFWNLLQRNRYGRQKRFEIISEALNRHGLKFRNDSKLCRDFVFKNYGDKRQIVIKMHMMATCFNNGANDKFKVYLEELKQTNPAAIQADRYIPLRDMFFDQFYRNWILQHPADEFHWVSYPNQDGQQPRETQNARGRGRGRGFGRGRGRGF